MNGLTAAPTSCHKHAASGSQLTSSGLKHTKYQRAVLQGASHPFAVLAGLFGLMVVWVLRPRIPQFTAFSDIVTRAEFPTLFRIIDDITTILHGGEIDTVLIDEEFNAGFGRYGLQWKRLLELGLPLLTILEPQERIAILSHELAHGVNGDPARGFVMQTTISTLVE